MHDAFAPVPKQSLSDDLAQRIKVLIERGGYAAGDRLPSISEMARRFGVGAPTLREALKKLETVGAVSVRHGSGVYVGEGLDTLLLSNPVLSGSPSKKTLLDLIGARIPLEVQTARMTAEHATPEHLARMEELLAHAEVHLEDDEALNAANMAFHREIAAASGNAVLHQLLEVLTSLFREEQRVILRIHGSRVRDHAEHRQIFEALRQREPALAAERMRAHLEGVREVLLQWCPDDTSPEA